MNLTYHSNSVEDLNIIAQDILEKCDGAKIFVFYGNLGAGKTSLIKAFCKHLNYSGEVTSPTFSIINQYETIKDTIFHMDLYRLKDEDEALEIGMEEYLFNGAYCFIEWPQVILNMIDEDYYSIEIDTVTPNMRKIEVRKLSIPI
jgi:tRNA threonylcarbamoyladenosine biosynthesis protein TsaE